MTSGTYGGISTRVNTRPGCGNGGLEQYGTSVTWTGGNALQPKQRTKRPFTYREAFYETTRVSKGKTYVVVKKRRFRVYAERTPSAYRPRFMPPNDFSKSWSTLNNPTVAYEGYNPGVSYGLAPTCFTGIAGPSDPWQSNLDIGLINKLQSRVNGSDFNLASFIGAEGHDTLKFIADTANRVARSLLALRKGNINAAISRLREPSGTGRRKGSKYQLSKDRKRAQLDAYRGAAAEFFRDSRRPVTPQAIDAIASSWLQWQLAAAPLLGDAKAAAEQLAHSLGPKGVRYSAKTKVSRDTRIPNGSYGAFWTLQRRSVQKSIVYYSAENPTSLPRLLGVLDPEIVLWNATPFSFVADMFIPIGSYLEARAFARSLTTNVILSVKTEVLLHNLTGRRVQDVGGYRRIDGFDVVSDRGSFQRTTNVPLASLLQPPKLKSFGETFSFKKVATAISLLVANRKSILPTVFN